MSHPHQLSLRAITTIGAFVLFGCAVASDSSAVKPVDPDSPEATVRAFYDICIEERVTGLPTESQFEQLRPLISDHLYGLLADARMEQVAFAKENPYEKPPWIEGDLFSSLFEGPTAFTTGAVEIEGTRARVTVDFVDDSADPEKPFRWSDDVLLVRNADGDWVIDDVVYRGDWDFASKGTLSGALSAESSNAGE